MQMYEETFPVYPSRGLWFTACPLHDLVDYLHAWPLFRLLCEAVWARAVPLVTLWYLGWWDEERQISYRVACAGKGRVERQILRTARGREACQLHTRHQTAPRGSPWQITGVWSSRGTVPATWLMFEGKSTLSLPCAPMCTHTHADGRGDGLAPNRMVTPCWIHSYRRVISAKNENLPTLISFKAHMILYFITSVENSRNYVAESSGWTEAVN